MASIGKARETLAQTRQRLRNRFNKQASEPVAPVDDVEEVTRENPEATEVANTSSLTNAACPMPTFSTSAQFQTAPTFLLPATIAAPPPMMYPTQGRRSPSSYDGGAGVGYHYNPYAYMYGQTPPLAYRPTDTQRRTYRPNGDPDAEDADSKDSPARRRSTRESTVEGKGKNKTTHFERHEDPRCIYASSCPNTHPDVGECVKYSASKKMCKRLQIVHNKVPYGWGVPGNYANLDDAFMTQKQIIGAPRMVSASGPSGEVTSVVVKSLPKGMAVMLVGVVKVLELLVVLYAVTRPTVPPFVKALLVGYYVAMLEYHMRQVSRLRVVSKIDTLFTSNGIHDIENMEVVQNKLLVMHDGGKVSEFQLRLKKVRHCANGSKACVSRVCCMSTGEEGTSSS